MCMLSKWDETRMLNTSWNREQANRTIYNNERNIQCAINPLESVCSSGGVTLGNKDQWRNSSGL